MIWPESNYNIWSYQQNKKVKKWNFGNFLTHKNCCRIWFWSFSKKLMIMLVRWVKLSDNRVKDMTRRRIGNGFSTSVLLCFLLFNWIISFSWLRFSIWQKENQILKAMARKKSPTEVYEGYFEATGIHGMQYMTRFIFCCQILKFYFLTQMLHY